MLTLGEPASLQFSVCKLFYGSTSSGDQEAVKGTIIHINKRWLECKKRLNSFLGEQQTFTHTCPHARAQSVSLPSFVSRRNMPANCEMGTWRYAAHHLVELSVSHSHTHIHTHPLSLIPLSCALGLGLWLLFPRIHSPAAVAAHNDIKVVASFERQFTWYILSFEIPWSVSISFILAMQWQGHFQ